MRKGGARGVKERRNWSRERLFDDLGDEELVAGAAGRVEEGGFEGLRGAGDVRAGEVAAAFLEGVLGNLAHVHVVELGDVMEDGIELGGVGGLLFRGEGEAGESGDVADIDVFFLRHGAG